MGTPTPIPPIGSSSPRDKGSASKPTKDTRGMLQFGTEVVATDDGTLTGLLGASPGASTTTTISLDMLAKCFKDKIGEWQPKPNAMIPSYHIHERGLSKTLEGKKESHEVYVANSERTARILKIT